MDDHRLELIAAYRVLAGGRNTFAGNPETWRPEAEMFAGLLPPRSHVLDVGCGAGRDALLLESLGLVYTGADISSEMLAEARKLAPHARFMYGDLYCLPFVSHEFDSFWCAATILHVPKVLIGKAVGELRRVVRMDAIGFVAVKEGCGERVIAGSEPRSDRFFSFWQKNEMARELSAASLEPVSMGSRKLSPNDSTTWLTYLVRAV